MVAWQRRLPRNWDTKFAIYDRRYQKREGLYTSKYADIFGMESWSHDPILEKIGQRSRSHWHIIYTAKMCHNSVLRDRINFILSWWHLRPCTTIGVQTACHINTGCLATVLKIPSNMTSLTTFCSIANIWNWCTRSPQDPCDVTHITLTDTPTKCTGCKFTNNLYLPVIMPIVKVVILY